MAVVKSSNGYRIFSKKIRFMTVPVICWGLFFLVFVLLVRADFPSPNKNHFVRRPTAVLFPSLLSWASPNPRRALDPSQLAQAGSMPLGR